MSTPTVLPVGAVGAPVEQGPVPAGFLRPALIRTACLLVPLPLALAAAEPLGQVPSPVPAGALATGWVAVVAFAGPGTTVRQVQASFGAVTVLWSALLALAPQWLVGPDLALAYAVSLPVLALSAALTAALATGAGGPYLRWSLPALLVAGAVVAGWAPPAVILPAIALLVIRVVVLRRALVPADLERYPFGGQQRARRGKRRRAGYLALGTGQVAIVALVWQAGDSGAPPQVFPPALVPALLAVPVVPLWVAWHRNRVAAGLAGHDERDSYLRYARRLGWATLAALLPPLVCGAALAGTAAHLPYGLSAHPDAPALLLAMAGGVLLAGLLAAGWLLAARDRPGLAAVTTLAPVIGTFGLPVGVPQLLATSLEGWGQLLPAMVVALSVGYAGALVLAARVLFGAGDDR